MNGVKLIKSIIRLKTLSAVKSINTFDNRLMTTVETIFEIEKRFVTNIAFQSVLQYDMSMHSETDSKLRKVFSACDIISKAYFRVFECRSKRLLHPISF